MKHYITAAHGQLSAINVDDCCNRPIVTMQNDNLVPSSIPRISRLLISVFYKGLPAAHTCVQMQYPYHGYNPATYAVFFFLNVKVE